MTTLAPGPSASTPRGPKPGRFGGTGTRVVTLLSGLLRAARPKQWLKNLLVLPAPAAAGVLDEAEPLLTTAVAFAAFCLAASGTYLINDARDVRLDRAHPRKRHRPVADGTVGVRTAYLAGASAVLAGLFVAGFAGNRWLFVALGGYVLLTGAYSLVLKRLALLDLLLVAAGFVLRAAAGAAAVEVPISGWFLIVTSLGSLLVVAGKRDAELARSVRDGTPADATRPTLVVYSARSLVWTRRLLAAGLLLAYATWALASHDRGGAIPLGLTILPFTAGVLRYQALVTAGHGEAPEDLALSDRGLLVAGFLVAVGLGVGIYAF